MFTGIIHNWARVKQIGRTNGQISLAFHFQKPERRVALGESIAVNGVCLTATKIDSRGFSADLLPETVKATNLANLKAGDWANMERSLKAGDALGGHVVSGHVDGTGRIKKIIKRGGNWRLLVTAPKTIISQLAVKGSIACEGVSLTLQSVGRNYFEIALIPHTLATTTLGFKKPGDHLNLEIDMQQRLSGLKPVKSAKRKIAELKRQGF